MKEYLMPVTPGAQLTLESMSPTECIQLLRDIISALALQCPDKTAVLSGEELVRAHEAEFKMTIRPTPCGKFIEDIRIEAKCDV
jgi:hypothetical protein